MAICPIMYVATGFGASRCQELSEMPKPNRSTARRKPARKRRSPSKSHDEIFEHIIEGLRQALSIVRGEADPSTYRVHTPEQIIARQRVGQK